MTESHKPHTEYPNGGKLHLKKRNTICSHRGGEGSIISSGVFQFFCFIFRKIHKSNALNIHIKCFLKFLIHKRNVMLPFYCRCLYVSSNPLQETIVQLHKYLFPAKETLAVIKITLKLGNRNLLKVVPPIYWGHRQALFKILSCFFHQ